VLRRRKNLIGALNTEAGKLILAELYNEFVKDSSLNENSNIMAYKLGQKELVQGLINESNITEDELENQYQDYEDNIYD
jgi:hypothetical protein